MIPLERTALSSAETWAGDVQPLDEAVDEEPAVTKCCPDRAEEVTTKISCKICFLFILPTDVQHHP